MRNANFAIIMHSLGFEKINETWVRDSMLISGVTVLENGHIDFTARGLSGDKGVLLAHLFKSEAEIMDSECREDRETVSHTNRDRAKRAKHALASYDGPLRLDGSPEKDLDLQVTDLIADLLHLVESEGSLSPMEIQFQAEQYFIAEKYGIQ